MEEREKTSIGMKPSTKTKLERLKLRLREAGISRSSASEAAIVEALVMKADFDRLLRHFEQHE